MVRPVLEIKQISKKFRISHESGSYLSLRDSLSGIFSRTKKTTEDFYALKDVSFNVNPGETVGIIGKNGAGKSTLLKILSKITPPSSGSITCRGRMASLLEVGTGFHPELTGRENIFFNGSILGMRKKEIERNFEAIVDFSGVEKFIDTPLKHYSSGMQLRLAFAVAAFLENEILIIDEVLAVGDAEFQKKCLGKMNNVSKSGRTILFVSHNMGAVTQLCSRGIWLEHGSVKGDGKAGDVIAAYYDSTSAGFNKDGIRFENNKSGDIVLESVVVNNGDYVYFGKEVSFSLSVTCSRKIEDIVFGIGFSNNDGVRMLTIDSDVLSNATSGQSIAEGKYKIDVTTAKLSLHPGKYFVDLGVRDSKSTRSYLYMPQAFNIEVMPSDETPHFFTNNNFNGGYRLPNNTTISKAD